jgi:L-aspartate oxidase
MKGLPAETDFVIIGAGVAGLRAAIELASAGPVLVLAKKEVTDSNTQYAQGGIAAALSDEDEVSLHLQDTLVAGDGLCSPDAVKTLVEEGPERIEELIAWGTQFDRNGTKLVFGQARTAAIAYFTPRAIPLAGKFYERSTPRRKR